MNQWWQYWPNYFDPTQCDKLIELAKQIPETTGQIGHAANRAITDTNVRRSRLRWLPRNDSAFYTLFCTVNQLFHEANKNAFGFDLDRFHEVQFTEYHAEDRGAYGWHHDTQWASPKLIRRKLSMVVQLSEHSDYSGGNFEMHPGDCDEVVDPGTIRSRGTVLVFPSFLRHRVTPVEAGVRYSLVTWMEGPFFR